MALSLSKRLLIGTKSIKYNLKQNSSLMKHCSSASYAVLLTLVALLTTNLKGYAQDDKWVTVIHETFDVFSEGTNTTSAEPDASLLIKDQTLEKFDLTKSSSLYQAGGAILFYNANGASLFTKEMNFLGDKLRISCKVKAFSAMSPLAFKLTSEGAEQETQFIDNDCSKDWQAMTFEMPAGSEKCALQISTKPGIFGSVTGVFLDEITVEVLNPREVTTDPQLIVNESDITFLDSEINDESYAKEITVKGYNLSEPPTYKIEGANADEVKFTASGDLTKDGGKVSVTVTHLKPGVHTAQLIISSGTLKHTVNLKGRGLGGNPIEGMPQDNPKVELQESFAKAGIPEGWKTFITAGYEDWSIQPSSLDKTNFVATMNAAKSSLEDFTCASFLITPCMTNTKGHQPEISYDLAVMKSNELFASSTASVYCILADGSMDIKTPLFTVNYDQQAEYAVLKNIKVKAPDTLAGKYFIGFYYQGATSASRSVAVEVDNIQISSKEKPASVEEATVAGAKVWRNGDQIYFEGLDGMELQVYSITGTLLVTFPVADTGAVTLRDANQRLLVRYGTRSLVL